MLPRVTLTRTLKNRPDGDPDGTLVIVNGELRQGTLCKQTLGSSAHGIVHATCIYISNHAAARFMSDIKRLLNRFFVTVGFSIGIKDCMTPLPVQRRVKALVAAAQRHIGSIRALEAEMPADQQIKTAAEAQVADTLKALLHQVGNSVANSTGEGNAFNVMASVVGSKGSVFNMAQVMALVGQTFVNGQRPELTQRARLLPSGPLPHQPALELSEALKHRGFIARPYKAGLSMQDAFLHNMGGREGLVDTAAKTSRTGYLQRRIVKAMESHHIAHDGSVRDAYQKMYQRWFGHDGLEPSRTLRVQMPFLLDGDLAVQRRCVADAMPAAAAADELARLLAARDAVRAAKVTVHEPNLAQSLDVYIPFDVAVLADAATRPRPAAVSRPSSRRRPRRWTPRATSSTPRCRACSPPRTCASGCARASWLAAGSAWTSPRCARRRSSCTGRPACSRARAWARSPPPRSVSLPRR